MNGLNHIDGVAVICQSWSGIGIGIATAAAFVVAVIVVIASAGTFDGAAVMVGVVVTVGGIVTLWDSLDAVATPTHLTHKQKSLSSIFGFSSLSQPRHSEKKRSPLSGPSISAFGNGFSVTPANAPSLLM